MNQTITMNPSVIEAVNGALLIVCLSMAMFFGAYVARQASKFGVGWRGYIMSEGAIAMFVFTIGDAMVRGAVWYMRHELNDGNMDEVIRDYGTSLAVIGVIIASFGGVCVIRIFSPTKFGPWPWLLTALAAMLFGFSFAF